VAAAQEAARDVYRGPATQTGAHGADQLDAATEAQLLVEGELGPRGRVVKLGDVDIVGTQPRHLVRLPRG